MMDPTYWMLFEEVRHALVALREQRFREAEHTMEDILCLERLIRNYRHRDPQALRVAQILRHLEWEWTPEGRLEWDRRRLEWDRERTEWERSPEWLREQARLQAIARREEHRADSPI